MPAWRPVLAATLTVSLVGLFAILHAQTPAPVPLPDSAAPVSFAEARHVIDRRCAACHSRHPSDFTFGVAPAGVMFDTPEQVVAQARRIEQRAVVMRTMPPANRTRITDDERALLGRWIAQGALLR